MESESEAVSRNQIFINLKECKLIMNNVGILNEFDFKEMGVEYHVARNEHWLGK